MKLLLDTHLLLWAAGSDDGGLGADRLSPAAETLIADLDNPLYFSAASIWEVAIKGGIGREDFRADPHLLRRGLLDNGYMEIPITSEHAAAVGHLPPLHKDPFDRMLVAQARVEGITLLTSDEKVAAYAGPARRV
ncbi:MAG TPA: type II toxin-antitoxin system VapC family toxin [Caulobacteraceae bacterium]